MSPLLSCLTLYLLATFAVAADSAKSLTISRIFNSKADFDSCTRDLSIEVDGNSVQLVKEEVIAETTGDKLAPGKSYPGVTDPTYFTAAFFGKRTFNLDSPVAEKVAFYFFRGTAGTATLNGQPLKFGPFTHHGGWIKAEVDTSALRKGENVLIFEAGSSCCIDMEKKPGSHSWTSNDGGKTWKVCQQGEFYVNIGLTRYPARGTMTSPVIDLANPENKNEIAPLLDIKNVSLEAKTSSPKESNILLEARSGITSLPDAKWSKWTSPQSLSPARYVQWRATLSTNNRLATSTLSQVSMNAKVNILADAAVSGASIEKFENQRIIRTSLPFAYQSKSKKLQELRDRYKLDEVIAPGKTQFEQLVLLRNWVRNQWPQNDNGPYERVWNALDILGAPEGHHGMCVQYGVAFTQCAEALGFNARTLILQNHCIADVWSDEYGKWAVMDVEAAVKPTHDSAHYIDTTTKVPLDMLELHNAFHKAALEKKDKIDEVTQVYYSDIDGKSQVLQPRPYPMTYLVAKRFLYPPRNNYLDQLEPWEEFQGCDNYHSSAQYWWKSEFADAAIPNIPLKTNRRGDLFWTLNQSQLSLTATTKADVLRVTSETFTPNFKNFEVQIDNGDWNPVPAEIKDSENALAAYDWNLHPGTNRLAVRAVNLFDRNGKASFVELKK